MGGSYLGTIVLNCIILYPVIKVNGKLQFNPGKVTGHRPSGMKMWVALQELLRGLLRWEKYRMGRTGRKSEIPAKAM